MSFVAIILGLLIWLSLPPLFAKRLSDNAQRIMRIACMVVGIATILGGILWNYLK